MPINLVKGQSEVLSISKLKIGLGWEPNENLSSHPYDLDVSAFLLGEQKKIINDNYLVFYNSDLRVLPDKPLILEHYSPAKYPNREEDYRKKTRPVDPNFSVHGSIDDTDGTESDGGDDETMNIDLTKVDSKIVEIVIAVSIYEHDVRRQNFGQVDDSYISIYNDKTNELLYKYELSEDFSTCTAVEFCSIYRRNNEWKVKATGVGLNDGLQSLVNKYS